MRLETFRTQYKKSNCVKWQLSLDTLNNCKHLNALLVPKWPHVEESERGNYYPDSILNYSREVSYMYKFIEKNDSH